MVCIVSHIADRIVPVLPPVLTAGDELKQVIARMFQDCKHGQPGVSLHDYSCLIQFLKKNNSAAWFQTHHVAWLAGETALPLIDEEISIRKKGPMAPKENVALHFYRWLQTEEGRVFQEQQGQAWLDGTAAVPDTALHAATESDRKQS